MQARDFGFAVEEDQSSASDTPRSEGGGTSAVSTAGRASPLHPGIDTAASPSFGTGGYPTSPGAEARSMYKDRHEGKTMQERLANLEFSDEEDDDDPLGLKQAKAGAR